MSWLRKYFSVNAWNDWAGNPPGYLDVSLFRLAVECLPLFCGPARCVQFGLIGLHLSVTYYPRGKA